MKPAFPSCLVLLVICVYGVAQNPAVTINVDVQAGRHPISPLIYGVNLFESAQATTILQDLNAPINRYGGNRASTYNWNLNADNRGNDFFFESISDDVPSPAGQRADTFITQTKNAGSEPMVTIPMLDWSAKAGTNQPFLCSYPKTKFPNQQFFDQFNTNCGNGRTPDGSRELDGADPSDAYVPNSIDIEQSFVQHLVSTHDTAANGGLKYYILDNEHDLWWQTHHDVVPVAPHNTEDISKMLQYAAMIKAQDPGAMVVGPEISGWTGYIFSSFDFQFAELNGYDKPHSDRISMNNVDYAPWLLGQFQQYANDHAGQRLLDVFALHYYPQGNDPITVNTRSLWDPNYVDNSYINDKIMLIPRMKQWVADNYPGTKIGITEYNWGTINNEEVTDNMGYAVAQADVLGIFGREGLDLATRFNSPVPNLPTYNAMKLYRNYDGSKSTFGDVSVSTTTATNPDVVVAFGAQRTSDSKATIMLLSKYATGDTPVTVSLANFADNGPAGVWQLSAANATIQHLADVAADSANYSVTLPPQSITLLVIAPTAPTLLPAATLSTRALNFGNVILNRGSAGAHITLTNSGQATLNIANIALSSGAIAQTTNCPSGLPVGASCRINFIPVLQGPVAGTLTITDDAADSPQSATITGNGLDFLINLARPRRSMRLTPAVAASRRVR